MSKEPAFKVVEKAYAVTSEVEFTAINACNTAWKSIEWLKRCSFLCDVMKERYGGVWECFLVEGSYGFGYSHHPVEGMKLSLHWDEPHALVWLWRCK